MDTYVIWFIVAFALIAAEMLTGTFYLLVVAIGVAAGGIVAWLGAGLTAQLVTAAAIGIAGTVILNRWKMAQRAATPAADQSLDLGASVHVESWNEDGTARAQYRGTQWDAALDTAATPRAELMYIKAMRGSTLILTDRKP